MTAILTVTLNPALDLSTATDAVVCGDKLRCDPVVTDPGGGGINVARAIAHLGGTARALVACGGHTGARLVALLEAEGVPVLRHDIAGDTRQSLAVTDRSSGAQYRFVLPGPVWDSVQAEALLAAIAGAAPRPGLVVLSGSQPPGVPDGFACALLDRLAPETRLILDTSGPALAHVLTQRLGAGHVLRLDGAESNMAAGRPLRDLAQLAGFAQDLVARGTAGTVVLALGAEGSVLANAAGCWHAVTPPVPVRSKVGAGDSFVGAFALALAGGAAPPQALAEGVAAASAAVMSDATALCLRADVEALRPQVTLTRLA